MYQATYVRVLVDNLQFQVNFVDKREFRLKLGTIGKLSLFDIHPLLLDYNEVLVTTYINSKAAIPELVAKEIEEAINSVTLSWRNWTAYVTDKSIGFTIEKFMYNLSVGTGRILLAPPSITKAVVSVFDRYNIASKSFEDGVGPYDYKVLTINDSYVVAKGFILKKLN